MELDGVEEGKIPHDNGVSLLNREVNRSVFLLIFIISLLLLLYFSLLVDHEVHRVLQL